MLPHLKKKPMLWLRRLLSKVQRSCNSQQSSMLRQPLCSVKLLGFTNMQQTSLSIHLKVLSKPTGTQSTVVCCKAQCQPNPNASSLIRAATTVVEHSQNCQSCRPAELRQGMPSVLSKLALGQAQAITAHRAEVKGSSPAMLASLFCGAIGNCAPWRIICL